MAKIVIKDLADSIDLDREAMTAVVGGSRLSRQQPQPASAGRMVIGPNRLVGLPRFKTATSIDKSLSSLHGTALK
jgi:hypothetical protein